MTKIRAVIFDLDGTLVDTSEFVFQSYEHALKKHATPKERREIASQVGKRLEDCYAFLAPDSDQKQILDAHRTFQAANIDLVKPFEYCEELLGTLHEQGIRFALCTSRSKQVEESLKATGLDPEIFSVIVDGSMVKQGKPHPEGIELILQKLGMENDEAAMVGDADVDILAGKNAKLALTVGITHGFGTREAITGAKPDYIIDSLQELTSIILQG